MDRRVSLDATQAFAQWLRRNNLHSYQEALADEGYDDLESFSMISSEEIEELCATVQMKPGHRKKMPALVDRAREDFKRELEIKKHVEEAERKRRIREITAEERKEEQQMEEQEEERLRKKRERNEKEETKRGPKDASTASQSRLPLPNGKR